MTASPTCFLLAACAQGHIDNLRGTTAPALVRTGLASSFSSLLKKKSDSGHFCLLQMLTARYALSIRGEHTTLLHTCTGEV